MQTELNNKLKQLHIDVQELLNKEYRDSGNVFKFNLTYNNVFKTFDVSLVFDDISNSNNEVYTSSNYKLLYDPSFSYMDSLVQLLDTY